MSFEDTALSIPPGCKSIVRDAVVAVEGIQLPKDWLRGWVEIHNDHPTAKMGFRFGVSKAIVEQMTTLTATSVVSIGVDTTEVAIGGTLNAGERVYRNLAELDFQGAYNEDSRAFVAHLSSAVGGQIRICKSSGPTKT